MVHSLAEASRNHRFIPTSHTPEHGGEFHSSDLTRREFPVEICKALTAGLSWTWFSNRSQHYSEIYLWRASFDAPHTKAVTCCDGNKKHWEDLRICGHHFLHRALLVGPTPPCGQFTSFAIARITSPTSPRRHQAVSTPRLNRKSM